MSETAEVAGYLWERGWAERNGGNITVDVTEFMPPGTGREPLRKVRQKISQGRLAGRSYLVKIAGARMRDVARCPEKHLLLITIAGDLAGYDVLWGGEGEASRPTSEFISHLKIHQFLREHDLPQKVFLHTHPDHLIALSQIHDYCQEKALNELLFSMHPEVSICLPEGAGVAPYRCPGSEELADVTVAALPAHRVILWEKHGCAAVAKGPLEAFDLIDIAEKAARIFFICKSAGYEPQKLSPSQLAELAGRQARK